MLDLMASYKLTADELLLVYLTFLAQDEENHPEYFTKWFNNGGQLKLKTLFESLKEKNVIRQNYNPGKYIPNDIEFDDIFLHNYFKHSGTLGKELFKEYPSFIEINGKNFSLKNISKKFLTLNEFYFYYSSQIKHNPTKHEEVLGLLRWGKSNNLINYGIIEFCASAKWEELKDMKENGFKPNLATSYDVYNLA